MKSVIGGAVLALLVCSAAWADPPSPPIELLDEMTGTWVLEGTMDGKQTTQDVEATWVLGRQYIQLHEVSRERDAGGRPEYEAIVYLTWEATRREYACLWLDSTGNGGLSAQAVGHAKPSGDQIRLLFKGGDGSSFHTTFAYDRAARIWRWQMDGEQGGRLVPFARVTLRRK